METPENKTPSNPNAFPVDGMYAAESLANKNSGMTLRDYFAAKAMQGLITNERIAGNIASYANQNDLNGNESVALISYNMADAMLKQREL